VINLSAKAFLYGEEYDAFEQEVIAASKAEENQLLMELRAWRKRGPVGKLHNIVVFICRTPQRREKFKKIRHWEGDEKSTFNCLNLVVDNATRWNSLYLMIKRAIQLRDRINTFCYEYADDLHGSSTKVLQTDDELAYQLKNDALSRDDWETLIEIVSILEKFYILTKRSEGTKLSSDRGVLSNYMETLNLLLSHLRGVRNDLEKRQLDPKQRGKSLDYLQQCTVNSWTKLDEYFAKTDDTPANYASVVTNPERKWKYFEHTWKDVAQWKDATSPECWLFNGEKALNLIWSEYKDLNVDWEPAVHAGMKRPREPDEYEQATNMALLYGEDDEIIDELVKWNNSRPHILPAGMTLPQFWVSKLKDKNTHRLALMGLDMASIPAMSSECERLFSQGKLMITGQRHRLKADLIEWTQCLRMWLIMDKKKLGLWKGKGNWNWKSPSEIHIGVDVFDVLDGKSVDEEESE
jgi:hypothetical protein